MKNAFKYAAVLAMLAGAAMAQGIPPGDGDGPPGNGYEPPKYEGASEAPNDKPITYTATCELPGGFGLIAYVDNPALLADIEARLAAGERVMIDVEGTEVTQVSPNGQMHVIGIVAGPGGRAVACYQSF